ncbi:MAG: glycosyltransferase family 2 protein [Acidobacteriaceae bacterium]
MPCPATFQTPADKAFTVCIVIPTFNRADVVIRCLEHLERQTFTDFEVVMVDDGSTDRTPQLIERYLATSPLRLRYVRQANSGPATARNRAISMTRAKLCIIIGDDILAIPEFVAIHVQFHRDNPAVQDAALGLTTWSEAGQTVTPFMRWMETGFQFDYVNLRAGRAPDWRHFYTSNLSVKTELLHRHPFDERFRKALMEDMELGYRIQAREGLRLVFLPEALAEHIHPMKLRQACRRAQDIGRTSLFFEKLWPEATQTQPRRLRQFCGDILGRNPWILRPLTWMTDMLTRFWCPNPLLGLTLAAHAAVGRRSRDRSVL